MTALVVIRFGLILSGVIPNEVEGSRKRWIDFEPTSSGAREICPRSRVRSGWPAARLFALIYAHALPSIRFARLSLTFGMTALELAQ
jgi:hypothetical protein